MRALVTMLLVMLVIAVGASVLTVCLIRQVDNMQTLADELAEYLSDDKANDAFAVYSVLKEKWEKVARWWGMALPHEEMDAVEEALAEIRLAFAQGEGDEAAAGAEHLRLALEVIRREELPAISNIF